MGRFYFFVIFFTAISISVYSQEVKLKGLEGEVMYRNNVNSPWQNASLDLTIPEGGAIKTGINGIAFLEIENRSKIWLRENTAVEIEQQNNYVTRLGLVFGKIKSEVYSLKRKEIYELRTESARCSIKNASFIAEADMEGKMSIGVIEGELELNYLIPPKNGQSEISISQGEYLEIKAKDKPARRMIMSKKIEMEALSKWDPNLSEEDRLADLKAKERDRLEIIDFSNQTYKLDSKIYSLTNKSIEYDFEAGRTLRDIHGNLLRVDQRLVRPDNSTLEFLNLVKRPLYLDYDYSSSYSKDLGFKYNGGKIENRYDMAVFSINLNKPVPRSVSEWPSYFNDDSVNANWATFSFANKTDNSDIFFISEIYKYDDSRGELVNNEKVLMDNYLSDSLVQDRDVIITGGTDFNGLKNIIDYNNLKGNSDGTLLSGNYKYGSKVMWGSKINGAVSYKKTGDDILYEFSADLYAIGGDTSKLFWYARENYIISNSGEVKSKDFVTKNKSDLISVIKETSVESVMYIKDYNKDVHIDWQSLNKNNVKRAISDKDTIGPVNIDIVIIPDLALNAVEKTLTALDKFKD